MDRKRKQLPWRELIGFGLLLALLAAGLISSIRVSRSHQQLSRQMEDAAWYALSGDWDRAKQTVSVVMEKWQKNWNPWAAVLDHGPMGQIDAGFAKLAAYAGVGSAGEYAAACREIARQLQTLGQSQQLSWWNLL